MMGELRLIFYTFFVKLYLELKSNSDIMFGKNDNQANERIIYQAKPNLILGCKKAIFGIILLFVLLFISGPIIQFIGNMQVYMISYIRLPITRYAVIAVFVGILITIIYIIWQIVGWYSKEYILTESKIVVKSGVFLTRKNYMPYSTIQDMNTSQSVFARLFNVGSISVYSAYDNNQISLDNVANPSEVEEIIFSKISSRQGYYQPPRRDFDIRYNASNQDYYQEPPQSFDNRFQPDEDYDDVVITPITHDKQYRRREYEYYPEDLDYDNNQRTKYEYEPYGDSLEHNINRAMDSGYESYEDSPSSYQNDSYYRGERNDYYGESNDYYDDNEGDYSYDGDGEKDSNSQKNDVDESSEKVIKRHFDKFKR
jgi:membrane protein YdbS with pleckstrin-like domain